MRIRFRLCEIRYRVAATVCGSQTTMRFLYSKYSYRRITGAEKIFSVLYGIASSPSTSLRILAMTYPSIPLPFGGRGTEGEGIKKGRPFVAPILHYTLYILHYSGTSIVPIFDSPASSLLYTVIRYSHIPGGASGSINGAISSGSTGRPSMTFVHSVSPCNRFSSKR